MSCPLLPIHKIFRPRKRQITASEFQATWLTGFNLFAYIPPSLDVLPLCPFWALLLFFQINQINNLHYFGSIGCKMATMIFVKRGACFQIGIFGTILSLLAAEWHQLFLQIEEIFPNWLFLSHFGSTACRMATMIFAKRGVFFQIGFFWSSLALLGAKWQLWWGGGRGAIFLSLFVLFVCFYF